MTAVQKTVNAYQDVLPIFALSVDCPEPHSFQGTGFLIPPGVFVTCWHCVEKPLEEKQVCAVGLKQSGGEYKMACIQRLERDAKGSDLALGWLDSTPSIGFELADEPSLYGTDVWSFGYPLTDKVVEADGKVGFRLNPRFLQGYITRPFHYGHPLGHSVPSYELDMPTPAGLSGAPLIICGTRRAIGVIYGTHDVALIEHFGRIDPTMGGRREPEVQRVVSFGLAHYTDTLRNAAGAVTEGMSLAEYVAKAA